MTVTELTAQTTAAENVYVLLRAGHLLEQVGDKAAADACNRLALSWSVEAAGPR